MDSKQPLPPPATSSPRQPAVYRRLLRLLSYLGIALIVWQCIALNPFTWWPWPRKPVKVNVIMMVSDGYGPASETFTRSFYQALKNNTSADAHYRLPLDTILVGAHRSRSSDSLITDSAAGATAFSCALKSYNGAIGVDVNGKPCGTVFEAAKQKGLLTGVVVTTRITDATPAAFISHAASRVEEPLMASQLIGGKRNPLGERTLDLAIGGGGCAFLPNQSSVSCRNDDEDTLALARELGWDVRLGFALDSNLTTDSTPNLIHSLDQDKPTLPLLALIAPYNLPFEIDRVRLDGDSRPPSLADTASMALQLLSQSEQNQKGFIVMIEGSQIDLCAHNNDPACHARETLAYQETIAAVKTFVDQHNTAHEKTILISTSDHETGGIALGRQLTEDYPVYAYYPERLLEARHSTPYLADLLLGFARQTSSHDKKQLETFIRTDILGAKGLGFQSDQQGGTPTDQEIQKVVKALWQEIEATPSSSSFSSSSFTDHHHHHHDVGMAGAPPPIPANRLRRALSDIATRRAHIGFSTEGHTGVDINVYAYGYQSHRLEGNQENTDIGRAIVDILDLDLDDITRQLNRS